VGVCIIGTLLFLSWLDLYRTMGYLVYDLLTTRIRLLQRAIYSQLAVHRESWSLNSRNATLWAYVRALKPSLHLKAIRKLCHDLRCIIPLAWNSNAFSFRKKSPDSTKNGIGELSESSLRCTDIRQQNEKNTFENNFISGMKLLKSCLV